MSLAGMPGHARVWLYAAADPLNPEQEKNLNILLNDFVSDWTAHGNPLLAGYEIREHFLIAIAVDEMQSPPSGCSIDKSVRLLKEFGSAEKIELFDRWKLPVSVEGKWLNLDQNNIREKLNSGKINAGSPVMNMMITKLDELRTAFEIPLSSSWLAPKLNL